MLFLRLCAFVSISVSISWAQTPQEKTITILATADTHAEIMPTDSFSLAQANKGWARLAAALREERKKNPAVLLADCGDTLQGAPAAYIHSALRSGTPNPVIGIMNALGYRAMVPGGHDFDFGPTQLKAAETQAAFPFIAANVMDSAGGGVFHPYVMAAVDGVSVALLGLSLPVAPNELGDKTQGHTFKDVFETAAEWVPRLRESEKADLVVAILHTGAEGPRHVPDSENTAILLAERVRGIDAIIASQSHQPMAALHAGVPIAQPSPFGGSIASITFSLQRRGEGWTVLHGAPENIPLDPSLPLDAQALQLAEDLCRETEEYLNTFATQLNTDLDGRWSTTEPTPLLQLLHDVQRQATGAQLSAASSPGTHIFVPKGATSVRQFFALAPHEHIVARIRITGAQLRAYLEHAATFFNYSYLPELINRRMPLADYDMIGGCTYALDISRPPGSRVTNLKYGDSPVREEQTFTMAISSHRLAGGGGYMDAIGFRGRAETSGRETLRNLLLDYVLSKPALDIRTDTGNWRTIPSLERERVMAAHK